MEYFSAMQLSKPLNYKKVNLWYSLNLIAFATCQNFIKVILKISKMNTLSDPKNWLLRNFHWFNAQKSHKLKNPWKYLETVLHKYLKRRVCKTVLRWQFLYQSFLFLSLCACVCVCRCVLISNLLFFIWM